ncbi:MAG: hypothetical protein E6Q83_19210 [Thiothrix sp.]|nr:MAG: hypothetical protein E6Q83_19210 [Thiothrix sp.]
MLTIKIKKAFLHLILSSFFITVLLGVIFLVWYPPPFLESSGLKEILFIVLAIDLILGPLLTLIVYKPNKPSLKFDLFFIIMMQATALIYGIYTIHQGHPVYVAYTVDRFTLINFKDSVLDQVQEPSLKSTGLWKPKFVYVKLPNDQEKLAQITFEVLSGKPDIDSRPEYYKPFEEYKNEILKGGIDPQKILSKKENKKLLNQFLSSYGKNADNYAFLPLSGKEVDVLWAWDRASGDPVDILAINPWTL